MVNEIKGPGNAINGLKQQSQSEQLKQQDTAKDTRLPSSGDDTVKLTEQGEKLAALEASIESQPVVDTKRVESLRNAILDGSYSVNAERTAEKLMAFETLLDQKTGEK